MYSIVQDSMFIMRDVDLSLRLAKLKATRYRHGVVDPRRSWITLVQLLTDSNWSKSGVDEIVTIIVQQCFSTPHFVSANTRINLTPVL